MKEKFILTDTNKQQGLVHIFYEIEMLIASIHLFQHEIRTEKRNEAQFAFLEARLLHERNLIDFFQKTKREQDDILASDYLPLKGSSLELVDDYETRINKYLSHLTYHRAIVPIGEWSYDNTIRILLRAKDFLSSLLNTHLSIARNDLNVRCMELMQSIDHLLGLMGYQAGINPQ